jgi:hypothetical protein
MPGGSPKQIDYGLLRHGDRLARACAEVEF